MRNRLISIFLLLLISSYTIGSESKTDSLQSLINSTTSTSKKINYLIQLSNRYSVGHFNNALKSIDRALQLAQQRQEVELLGRIYFTKADLLDSHEDYTEAVDAMIFAIDYFHGDDSLDMVSICQYRLGALYEKVGDLSKSLHYYLEAKKHIETGQQVETLVSVNMAIGNLFLGLDESESALPFFRDALAVSEKLVDLETYAQISNVMGVLNETLGEYDKALDFYYLALRQYKKSNDRLGRAQTLANIAKLNFENKDIDQALLYFNNALAIYLDQGKLQEQAMSYLWIGKCHFNNNDLMNAEIELSKALAIAEEKGLTVITRDASKILSQIFGDRGEYEEAYRLEALYNKMHTSLSNEQAIKERARVEFQYKFEKEQKERVLEAEEKAQQQSFMLRLLGGLLLLFGVIAILSIWIYLVKRKSNMVLASKNAIIKKSYEDVRSLSEIGKALTAKLNVEEIVSTVYDSLRQIIDAEAFAIGLFNQEKNTLDFSGAIENDETLPFFSYDLSDSNFLASLCFNSQQEILINDYEKESAKYLNHAPRPRAGGVAAAMIYLPLLYKDKKVGVITVQSSRKKAYARSHISYLQNLANFAVIALENARTYTELAVQNSFNMLMKSTIPNPMFFKDRQGVYRDCNPAFLEFIGRSHEEVIGKTAFDVAPFYLAEIYQGKDEELLEEKVLQVYESSVVMRDGTQKDVRFFKDILWTNEKEIGGILGIIHDVTDFKRNEEQLKIFKELAEASGQGFCIADHDMKIFYVNPTLHEMINEGSGDKLEGKKFGLSFPGPAQDRLYNEIVPHLRKRGQWTGEMERMSRSGRRLPTIENFFIIPGEDEGTFSVANISTDISHQKQIELDLKESHKSLELSNQTKDSFFSIISHDLKSPFNSILGFANLLNDSYDELDEDEKRLYIKQISESSELTFQLIEDLLTWSRAQTGQLTLKPQVFDLSELVSDVINLSYYSGRSKEIMLSSTVLPNTYVNADRDITYTILRNLVSNGLKFTHAGGHVSVVLEETLPDAYHISVRDTGVGISEEDQKKLFKIDEKLVLFGTNKELGTGMGLKLSNQLAQLNNGKMWFESEMGKGSKFFFSIPRGD